MTTYAARGATEQPECYGAPPPRVRGITGGTAIFSPSQAPSAHIATTKNAEAARYQASVSIIRNSSAREVDRTRDRGVTALKITGLTWSAGGCPRPPPRTRRPLRAAGSSAADDLDFEIQTETLPGETANCASEPSPLPPGTKAASASARSRISLASSTRTQGPPPSPPPVTTGSLGASGPQVAPVPLRRPIPGPDRMAVPK